MFLCRSQADHANRVVVRSFGENHHMEARIDQTDGNDADFAIVEPVILSLKRRIPIEPLGFLEGNAMLRLIDGVLQRIELDSHPINVHPLNGRCKCLVPSWPPSEPHHTQFSYIPLIRHKAHNPARPRSLS